MHSVRQKNLSLLPHAGQTEGNLVRIKSENQNRYCKLV